jgi:hypothetical protein
MKIERINADGVRRAGELGLKESAKQECADKTKRFEYPQHRQAPRNPKNTLQSLQHKSRNGDDIKQQGGISA